VIPDRLRRITEKTHVGAHGDEGASHRQIPFRVCLHRRENSAWFAGSVCTRKNVRNCLLPSG
jgi:hypothetical protein